MTTTITIGTKVKIHKPQLANKDVFQQGGHGRVGTVTSIKGNCYTVDLGHSNQVFHLSLDQMLPYNG
jgi:ribosomal protein L21E